MLVFKIINQQLVQVAIAGQQPARQVFSNSRSCNNQKLLKQFARQLVQSSAQSQKITSANNQQLIPVARNISFRKCQQSERARNRATETSAKAQFSSISNQQSHFISADQFEPYVIVDDEPSQSPIEVLKRAAKDVRERRVQATNTKSTYYGQSFNEAMATSSERRLVVLLSWLEAKEKHIEKYRQFYLARGFDVLNVKTSPWDLLLPNRGARKISEDFVRFMFEKQYSNVVVHGFSVGGYMFGRFLLEMDRHDPKLREKLTQSIRGIVFDSLVPIEGVAVGVARSIFSNPIGAKLMEHLLNLYLLLGHRIATKYYLEASDKVWGGPLKCPTLFLMSKTDNISDHRIVERLASVWSGKGIECQKMLFESSPHVQLYTKHHDQYVDRVDRFLEHIKVAPEKQE